MLAAEYPSTKDGFVTKFDNINGTIQSNTNQIYLEGR